MCWRGWIPPRRKEGPALGVSTPQVCIRVVPGKRELLLFVLLLLLLNYYYLKICILEPVDFPQLHFVNIRSAKFIRLSKTTYLPHKVMARQNESLLLRPVSCTPVHQIWFMAYKTRLPEGCCLDHCDMFTNRCACVMDVLAFMLTKCDLATQSIELLHSRSLRRGIFQRVLTPGRIDLCTQFL